MKLRIALNFCIFSIGMLSTAWADPISRSAASHCINRSDVGSLEIQEPAEDSLLTHAHELLRVHLTVATGELSKLRVFVGSHQRKEFDPTELNKEHGISELLTTLGTDGAATISVDPGLFNLEVVGELKNGKCISDARRLLGPDSKSRAIVIGVSQYDFIGDPLAKADDDAKGMADHLIAEGIAVIPIYNQEATKTRIRTELDDAMSLSADTTFYFYFSGHGYATDKLRYDRNVSHDHQVYLVPTNGDVAHPDTLLPLQQLLDSVRDIPSKRKVIILDACFSGGNMSVNSTWKAKAVKDIRGHAPSDYLASNNSLDMVNRTGDEALALFSTAISKVSFQSVKFGGLFTHYLLKAATDASNAGNNLNIRQAYDAAEPEVEREAAAIEITENDGTTHKGEQKPKFLATDLSMERIDWSEPRAAGQPAESRVSSVPSAPK